MSLCGDDELGDVAADGFGVLLTDDWYVLNLKCRAIIRVRTYMYGACSHYHETDNSPFVDFLQATGVHECDTKVSGAVQIS